MNNTPADTPSLSSSDLRRIVYSRFAIALVVLPLFFFVPAGTCATGRPGSTWPSC